MTLQHGHEVIASIKLEPIHPMSLEDAMQAIVDFERTIRSRMPQCKWIFCEPSWREHAD